MDEQEFDYTNKLFESLEGSSSNSEEINTLVNGWKIGDIVRYIDCDEDDEFEGEITSIEDINCFSIDEFDGYYIDECELVERKNSIIKEKEPIITNNTSIKTSKDKSLNMINGLILNRKKKDLSIITSPKYNKLKK